MYYLRKEPYIGKMQEVRKTNGEVIPEREYIVNDRAIYKHPRFSRFYRGEFKGIDGKYQGMKLYTCKTLKKILELRQSTSDHCNELFDVYDENGKVKLESEVADE